jgi:hypothetical protein
MKRGNSMDCFTPLFWKEITQFLYALVIVCLGLWLIFRYGLAKMG